MAGAGGTKKLWLSDAPIEAQLPGHSDIPSTVRSVVVRPYGVSTGCTYVCSGSCGVEFSPACLIDSFYAYTEVGKVGHGVYLCRYALDYPLH